LGWRAMFDPSAPRTLRAILACCACGLSALLVVGALARPGGVVGLWQEAHTNRVAWLIVAAAVLALARLVEVPRWEPMGYWPRWALVGALTAYSAALVRLSPNRTSRPLGFLIRGGAAAALWYGLVAGGIALTWYHRPLERLREIVPGRIFISAMPTR